MCNNGCIWTPNLAGKCEINYWLSCGVDGQSVVRSLGVGSHDNQFFWGG